MEEENEGGSGGGEAEREKGDWEGGGREMKGRSVRRRRRGGEEG